MARDMAKVREYVKTRRYGLTQAGFDLILAEENWTDPICGIDLESVPWHVDHEHDGRAYVDYTMVRGILCADCNIYRVGGYERFPTSYAGLYRDEVKRYLADPPARRIDLSSCAVPGKEDTGEIVVSLVLANFSDRDRVTCEEVEALVPGLTKDAIGKRLKPLGIRSKPRKGVRYYFIADFL